MFEIPELSRQCLTDSVLGWTRFRPESLAVGYCLVRKYTEAELAIVNEATTNSDITGRHPDLKDIATTPTCLHMSAYLAH